MPISIFSPEVAASFTQANTPQTRSVKVGRKTIKIQTPFPSPADWRDQWIYFLMLDRFNNPKAPPRFMPYDGIYGEFQGGTFNGVRQKLDYLQQLGVGALWLSPVLKNCQHTPYTYHGYGIQDFLQIEPRFASNPNDPQLAQQEFRALVDEAHARGLYVICDIVLNHGGDVFEYVFDDGERGAEADWRDTPYTIRWRDEHGVGRADWTTAPDAPHPDAAVWPSELRRNEFFRRQGRGDEAGGDFASLKELVTAQGAVRDALIRAYQYAIAKYDVDGFRIDTLKFIEPDFARVFGNAMREYALSIGKKNFFTFGEVYDNEEQIARFIGRHALEDSDMIGVDAALDFPLFYKLPAVAKGQLAPTEIINTFERRKAVQRGVLSSHGEASRYFVTFLDNHDQTARFYHSPITDPEHYLDQLTLGVGCLFTLQGIPCLYYGSEQGLHGAGRYDAAVREALWGKTNAFDQTHRVYQTIQRLAGVRQAQAALRYGRQYFRPISGDGVYFGASSFAGGVLAFSRILNDQEVLVVANTNTQNNWVGEVVVDAALNAVGVAYGALFSNKTQSSAAPGVVSQKDAGHVLIREINGAVTYGPVRAVRVSLQPMELQILHAVSTS